MNKDLLENFSAGPVLEGLHGFQRDAVEHAFHRLYRAGDGTDRFLIADEVGLGKTMIARGILAKALEEMRGDIERIDIVYICSNLSIASQNINRLNPIPDLEFAGAERITLLPITLKNLANNDINFVSFTPGTSLDLKESLGTKKERILLYCLLKEHWSLTGKAPLNVLQGGVRSAQRFRNSVAWFQEVFEISSNLARAFNQRVTERDSYLVSVSKDTLRSRFEYLCHKFGRKDANVGQEDRKIRSTLVGELRMLLAEVCIDALEPDLIILDEFQRFKHLLTTDSEAGELAARMFEWTDGHAEAKVLLLSATPYKAYTLQHEMEEDDHYADFIRTIEFLQNNQKGKGNLRRLFIDFRKAIYALPNSDGSTLEKIKEQIETELRKVMSRTERLATVDVENGMLKPFHNTQLGVNQLDLHSYRLLHEIGEKLDTGSNLEYWKSAAFPLNFMEAYKLKELLSKMIEGGQSADVLTDISLNRTGALLNFDLLEGYQEHPVSNAKTRKLIEELDKYSAFYLLWLPPASPYYTLSGAYAKAAKLGLTKRLLFSAWHLVPRSVASLLSYESERRVFHLDEEQPGNTAYDRKTRKGLLQFTKSDDRLSGLPVFTLLYPSRSLAELCDPKSFASASGGNNKTSAELLAWAEARIREKLSSLVTYAEEDKTFDASWYWAAPFIIERQEFSEAVDAWWSLSDVADIWSGEVMEDEERDNETGWRAHVEYARVFALGSAIPEGPAPRDLPMVLALMALAGPGTCALRGLLSLFPAEANKGIEQRKAASRIAWGFRSLFNRPESMALVRAGERELPYWRRCLHHGVLGCLSAVIDEYLHVLRDSCGLTTDGPEKACPEIAEAALSALNIRAAPLVVDELYRNPGTKLLTIRKRRMRALFAMRFGSDKVEDKDQVQRDVAVRAAFNSPFWPFVLASTSIGQEGLDFHWYCHAITHWNLPSNPVELEQREGRIHRFKGHAIRKNIANLHLLRALQDDGHDIWSKMFDIAESSTADNGRGLIPYWLYQIENGAWIERHVPMFPLSKDIVRYEDLRRALGAYRMVFGQPRQDELLAYLLDKIPANQLALYVEKARIDLSPPQVM